MSFNPAHTPDEYDGCPNCGNKDFGAFSVFAKVDCEPEEFCDEDCLAQWVDENRIDTRPAR